ncbi:MAG: CBS domain-containing protein [Nitrososphaerota archaeon]|nr:CBS domain-containing protein [Nitrososphaerota archaeon]
MVVTVKATDVMDKSVIFIDASTSVLDTVKKMADKNSWSVIVERQNLPVGVVTDRDVLRRCISKGMLPDRMKIDEIMSSPIVTIAPDTTAGEMMEKMVEASIRRLFVVDNGKIVGKVTQTNLFQNSLNLMLTLSSMRHQL